MVSSYTKELGLQVQKTNIRAQKIDASTLVTYGMVITGFPIQDKFGKARFFQETFQITDISLEVVIQILFWTLSKVEVHFVEKELTWKTYTIAKPLLCTKKV